jgi:phage portal protein BeeE
MQDKQHPSLRVRLANRVLGTHKKDFIQALSPLDGWSLDGSGRLKQYDNKPEQLSANIGWCYTANTSIADPSAAVELKLFKTTRGKREEIDQHEILDLINAPNLALTGEQLPAHRVQMELGETYQKSTVRLGKDIYPLAAFVRDLNPDPANPYYGRSLIAAAASAIDTENQMKEWNSLLRQQRAPEPDLQHQLGDERRVLPAVEAAVPG